jgi:hypothetical protein
MREEKHIQLKYIRIPPLLLFLPYVRTIYTGYRHRTVCEAVWGEQKWLNDSLPLEGLLF